MLKSPKKTKYKSPHFHHTLKGLKGNKVSSNIVRIKAQEPCLLTPKHREVFRRIMSKPIREEFGKLTIRFFPHLSLSKKPIQTRMGKGKGKHNRWVSPIKNGGILFEIRGPVPEHVLKNLYKKVAFRLPVFSKIIIPKILHKKNYFNEKNKNDILQKK